MISTLLFITESDNYITNQGVIKNPVGAAVTGLLRFGLKSVFHRATTTGSPDTKGTSFQG